MSLTRLIRTISYSGQSSCADSVVYPGAAGFQAALCPATSLCRFLPCVTFSSMPPPLLRFLLCASSSPSLSLLLLLPFACSFAPPPLRFLLCAASSPSLAPLRRLPFVFSFAPPPPLRFLLCASSPSLAPLRRLPFVFSFAPPPLLRFLLCAASSPPLVRLQRILPFYAAFPGCVLAGSPTHQISSIPAAGPLLTFSKLDIILSVIGAEGSPLLKPKRTHPKISIGRTYGNHK